MFDVLLALHSIVRWVFLAFLIYSVYRAFIGFYGNKVFSKRDNFWRHWTATVGHIQLLIGMVLLLKSPTVELLWKHFATVSKSTEFLFMGFLHALLMFAAIVLLTVGSALAKRKTSDRERFRTMFIWFGITLLIVFIAIPWPFSPLADRPLIRSF